MNILAIDTSTPTCSVAVTCREKLLVEMTSARKQTHSKHIMDMILSVMEAGDLTISEMDGFAVTQGPGSFTGLRIGISTIKGLALASAKPLAGVSGLDVLAYRLPFSPFPVCVMTDARKGEVYCARYRFKDTELIKESGEFALPPEDALSDIDSPCVFIGSGAILYKTIISDKLGSMAHFVPEYFNIISASAVAGMAWKRFEKQDTDNIAAFAPRYIRKSDAELNFGKGRATPRMKL